MDAAAFHAQRRFAETSSGRIAYITHGNGPPALLLHGVPLNGFHWRHVIERVGDLRSCIAPDLLGLGYTVPAEGQEISFTAQARMVGELLDSLGLDQVDLVGNDSGGAIAQIFAATHPERVLTLTLTNCDVHDHWPPAALARTLEAARAGVLADGFRRQLEQPSSARSPNRLGAGYADPFAPTDEAVRVYLEPLLSSHDRIRQLNEYFLNFDNAQTVAIEEQLRSLTVPTLIVWALDDVFFDIASARWLRDTIPGVVGLVEVPEAKLFFPEDRPDALVRSLRELWAGTAAAIPS